MEEDSPAAVDVVMKYATYEEFLDSQVTRLDLSYLEVWNKILKTLDDIHIHIRMKN